MEKGNILNILRSNRTVFTFKEILIASGEKKANLLRRRLNYYVKNGQLYHLRRGIYAKSSDYNRFELATKIYTPAYISFETVLAKEGVIFQYYNKIFVASYQPKEIECDNFVYSFKKIKDTILNNILGIDNRENYFIASKERAFLDTLYLNKDYYFDNLSALDLKKINLLLPIYNSKKMNKRVKDLFKGVKNDNRY